MEKLIQNMMLEAHDKINNSLIEFEKNKSSEEFSKFKWLLEKHFFVEENAIFTLSDELTGKEVSDIFELMKQHGEIMGLVNNIEVNISNNAGIDVSKLRATIDAHSNFEDEVFYPQLDELLTNDQKINLREKIGEVVRE